VFAQRYQLEEFVGKGGMALVFRATDMRTGHDVAVKILRPEFNSDKEFLERFQREAVAASKMSHHNIVNLLDVGSEDGYQYLVLEFVSGRTLKAVIADKGKLPENVAGQIGVRILSALQHAHNNGIIHRDVKPENVLVNAEEHIKVSDFGIARVAGSNTLSKDDKVIGSAMYFSPEQARGENVTIASDIYSVGVVMYEMLTGRIPFEGDTPVAIALQHISSLPQPLRSLNDAVSPAMERVVLTALSKDPQNRYRNAADMARAIRVALDHPDMVDAAVVVSTATDGRTHTMGNSSARTQLELQRRRKKTRAKQLAIMLALTMLVIGAMASGTVYIVQSIVNSTAAPYLIGATEQEAVEMGRESGLVVEIVRQSDDIVPAGQVILQSREYQYKMKRGDVIVITVSTGPKEQGVPSLVGYTLDAARAEAEKYGFSLLAMPSTLLSDEPLNTVLEQTPCEGEMLAYGDIIQVVISSSVTVPRLTGLTRNEAMDMANRAGMKNFQFVEYPTTDESQFDRVADQRPLANERVMYNTQLTLLVYVPQTEESVQPAAENTVQDGLTP